MMTTMVATKIIPEHRVKSICKHTPLATHVSIVRSINPPPWPDPHPPLLHTSVLSVNTHYFRYKLKISVYVHIHVITAVIDKSNYDNLRWVDLVMTALTVMTTTIKMMMGNKHEWHTLRRLKFNLKKAKLASIFQKLIQAMKLDWSHQKLVYMYKRAIIGIIIQQMFKGLTRTTTEKTPTFFNAWNNYT